VERAKAFEGDEVPGDFGDLKTPCPKCGGVIKENYRRFQCQQCEFGLPTFLSGRLMEPEEVEALVRDGTLGPLQGFRSRQGFPFTATLKLNPDRKLEFDFGAERRNDETATTVVDFTGQTPLGACPKCGGRVFDGGSSYLCERSVGKERSCTFRSAKVILQQPVDPAQMTKLLAEGRTDLLTGFVSKRNGRKFEAFLVVKNDKVGFEFRPREAKRKGSSRPSAGREAPPALLDFSGQEPLGPCPKCGARVFEGPASYVCERGQAEAKRCTFRTGKTILQQPIDRDQMRKLLGQGRTDLLEQFVSRGGKPFRAQLVLEAKGKVIFEFPSAAT
jgi:DNA topoisomerase-3